MLKKPFLTTALAGLLIGALSAPAFAARFHFALIGDQQYNAFQETQFSNLINDINAENEILFVVHDGDFKSGSSPCTDALFESRRDQFNTFKKPFVFLFGDNEWTDCHRSGGDPLERLDKLRELFTQGDASLGKKRMPLLRQSEDPAYSKFRENVLWSRLGVVFAGFNIVGSNNNRPTHLTPGGTVVGNQEEYDERNAATIAWLHQAFTTAKENNGRAVMLIMQANPYENTLVDPTDVDGFADFMTALQEETLAFGKPVVLVHGDSHYFRIDKPMRHANGTVIENFTRVETFGQPDVHWLRATVDTGDPNIFSFRQEIVQENVPNLP